MSSVLLVFDKFEPASNYIKELVKESLNEVSVEKVIFLYHTESTADPIFSQSEKIVLLSSIIENSTSPVYLIDGNSFENEKVSLYNKIVLQKQKYADEDFFLLLDSKKFQFIRETEDFVFIRSLLKIILYVFPEDRWITEERQITTHEIIFINNNEKLNELADSSIYHLKADSYSELVVEYMNKSSECAIKRIKKHLSEARFQHSLRVAGTVKYIFQLTGISDPNLSYNTYLAALYHDICKEIDISEQIRIANEVFKIKDYPSSKVLHGYVAEWYLRKKYFFENEDILKAIREHTIPSNNPDLMTKILYLADHLELAKKEKYSKEKYDLWWNLIEDKNINKAFEFLRLHMKEKYPNDKVTFYS